MQKELRQSQKRDGKLPSILIEADNIAEGVAQAIVNCYEHGHRTETPKHRQGMSLGFDADINITIKNPDAEPKICSPAIWDDARGVMQYILEVTHGIHNHWEKSRDNPDFWGYTYNGRFVKQLPFVFHRIKYDWNEKKRITGRDYQFTTWRYEKDIIVEQDDPPCMQRGHLRFLQDDKGGWYLNLVTDWRSRDLYKAWNENVIAFVELQKLMADKISDMLGVSINLGTYTDRSSSLHLYGLYLDRDNLGKTVGQLKKQLSEGNLMSCTLDSFLNSDMDELTKGELKSLIAAQNDAELKGYGKQQSKQRLAELGYDYRKFPHPKEWDSWPEFWNTPAYVKSNGVMVPNPDLLKI